jgi:hypothetical protein
MTDGQLKKYLNDKVYSSTLRAISDLKEYRSLQKSLFQTTRVGLSPSISKNASKPKGNGQLNAQFNSAFIQQVDKNNMDKLLEEEKALSEMMQIDPIPQKQIKLFHTLTFAEIVDNLATSTVLLFKQIYSFDVNGLMTSYDNHIYYGIIFVFVYVILRIVWQELET